MQKLLSGCPDGRDLHILMEASIDGPDFSTSNSIIIGPERCNAELQLCVVDRVCLCAIIWWSPFSAEHESVYLLVTRMLDDWILFPLSCWLYNNHPKSRIRRNESSWTCVMHIWGLRRCFSWNIQHICGNHSHQTIIDYSEYLFLNSALSIWAGRVTTYI